MTKKDDLKKYEDELAAERIHEFFSDKVKTGQSRWSSLLEAHVNSLIGAPPAVFAHILMLSYAGNWATDNPIIFATATWPVFFYISVGRMFTIRRVFEKYGVNLEPVNLIRRINHFLRHGKTQTQKKEEKSRE